MKNKIIALNATLLLWGVSAHAAEIAGMKVSGEASFDYNYLSSGDYVYPAAGGAMNNQYRFNQAQLILTKETDQLSFLARLNYQPTDYAQSATATSKTSFGTLDQLEIYYKVTPEFSIGFGRLASTLGLESLTRSENVFYVNSVSYQGILPGYAEGLRAKYNPGDWLAVTVSTYNRTPTNAYGDDNTPTKTTEASATGVAGGFMWYAGILWGTDGGTSGTDPKVDRQTSSIWFTEKFNDEFSLSAFYDTKSMKPQDGSKNYAQSIAGQLAYTNGRNVFALRYESVLGAGMLDTLNGTASPVFYPGADRVQLFTVGESFNLSEYLRLYIEYRYDSADQPVLKKSDGEATKDGHMITLGTIAHF